MPARRILPPFLAALAFASPAIAGDVLPPRSPDARLGDEPWPGLRPADPPAGPVFPLDALVHPARWRPRSDAFRPPLPPVPFPHDAGAVESPASAVDPAWPEAIAAARAGRAEACLTLLGAMGPAPLATEQRARRLAFAAAVVTGRRSAADSLFYRMAWSDGGATAGRLAAWRHLEEEDVRGLRRALSTVGETDPGGRAAAAWLRWREGTPAAAAFADAGVSDAPGAAGALLALAAARDALTAGDAGTARAALAAWTPDRLPTEWLATRSALAAAAGEGPDGTAGGGADDRELAEVEADWLAHRDAEAISAIDAWLARWPRSPLRPHGLLLRADLRLAAGDVAGAGVDLDAVEERSEGAVRFRAGVARVRLDLAEGRFDGALRRVGGALASAEGRAREDELLYLRWQAERGAGRDDDAFSTRLLLEEAFPASPWYERLRAEGSGGASGPPPREPIPRTGVAPGIDPPPDGPWGVVLWGEDFLVMTAEMIDTDAAEVPPAPDPPGATPAGAGGPGPGTPWSGLLGLGGGARLSAFLEGGAIGEWDRLAVRGRVEGVRTEDPGTFPSAQRGALELSAFGRGEGWRGAAVAETRGRGEDAAFLDGVPDGGLAGPVSADWSGLRFDAAAPEGEVETEFRAVFSSGSINAGERGAWEERELRIHAGAAAGAAERRVRGDLTLARRRHAGPDLETEVVWHPDLRLTRRFGERAWLGVRATLERGRGFVLPVAGVEWTRGALRAWVSSEPELTIPSFRDRFVAGGDWNLPDLRLPAVRRDIDLRGGVRVAGATGELAVAGAAYRAGGTRSWRRDDGFWRETAVDDARGMELSAHGERRFGTRVLVAGEGTGRRLRAGGESVAYVPSFDGALRVAFAEGAWIWETRLTAVAGRRDENGDRFGSFARWDVEATYRLRRSLEYSVRIENVLNEADARWPGVSPYGRGIFGGVRLLFGA